MSQVEQFYEAMRSKYGSTRKWSELHPQEQMMVVQACNILLDVLNRD